MLKGNEMRGRRLGHRK